MLVYPDFNHLPHPKESEETYTKLMQQFLQTCSLFAFKLSLMRFEDNDRVLLKDLIHSAFSDLIDKGMKEFAILETELEMNTEAIEKEVQLNQFLGKLFGNSLPQEQAKELLKDPREKVAERKESVEYGYTKALEMIHQMLYEAPDGVKILRWNPKKE